MLVMMLVASAILVGPVSAANPVYTSYFELTAGGNTGGNYFSYAETLDGQDAGSITTTAALYNQYGNYLDHVSANVWNDDHALASDTYSGGDQSYVQASFDSVSPNDQCYYATYYI